MIRFFKYLLATFSGAFLALIIFGLLILGIIGVIVSTGSKELEVKPKSVLLLRLHEPVHENSKVDPFAGFMPTTDDANVLGLHDILFTIEKAATDPNITGIVLYTDFIQAGYSTLQEIRIALEKFKATGKFVSSYSDMYTQKSYFLSSVANQVYINPQGMFELNGLTVDIMFYKKLLEKIGLQPVVFRAGKYKSFVESVTRENMSPENREQVQAYINSVWSQYGIQVSKNRVLTKSLNQLADSLYVWNAQSAFDYKLVDKLMYYDEFLNKLKSQLGLSNEDKVPFVAFSEYMNLKLEEQKNIENPSKNTVAVIVAAGSIVMGQGDEDQIGSESLSKQIREARKDKSIKAIVLRINSGGGSALASEAIWREVKLAADTKPMIVSMGDMAASGGYYIAAPAHVIVANPTTLTGSIGVFGMLVNAQELCNKIGVSIDTVKTNAFSDFGSSQRVMTDYETQVMTKGIDQTYTQFKSKVAEGRKLSMVQVENIAQGRIWSGKDALSIGLVDTLGGLNVAIAIAIKKAKLQNDYIVKYYPESKSALDQIMDKISGKDVVTKEIEALVGNNISSYYYLLKQVPREKGVYTQMPIVLKIN